MPQQSNRQDLQDRNQSKSNSRGFSCSFRLDDRGVGLIEVLIVLGLIGIMAGGAAPSLHRMNQEWA
ncbi:MAG: prepilin-type N-terminal cleavage/methylation domain-containing protein, partial [Acidobacteriota bacterium]